MTIFTVCNINQLANACVLGKSIKETNPEYEFVIGLVDNPTHVPNHIASTFAIVNVNELTIEGFKEMSLKYTFDEIVSNFKPFFAIHFLKNTDKLLYLDCTSVVVQSLKLVDDLLGENNIILTPQLLFAGQHPDEKQILNSGIYHSGFIGFKKSDETLKFLDWWGNNTKLKGFKDMCKGLNADQLWLEHVPALYEGVFILKNEGINIGYWNLPERNLNQLKNNSNLISLNYKGMKFPSSYIAELQQFSYSNLSKVTASFGIEDPNKPTIAKTIAGKIRSFNKLVDVVIDKITA